MPRAGDCTPWGSQWSSADAVQQAIGIYRHWLRLDKHLQGLSPPPACGRLMDTERAKPKAAATPNIPVAAHRVHERNDTELAAKATIRHRRPVPGPGARGPVADGAAAVPQARRLLPAAIGSAVTNSEREIGRGAMGIVYLGRDTGHHRLVAIKSIPVASGISEPSSSRPMCVFLRRQKNRGRLNHPKLADL